MRGVVPPCTDEVLDGTCGGCIGDKMEGGHNQAEVELKVKTGKLRKLRKDKGLATRGSDSQRKESPRKKQ